MLVVILRLVELDSTCSDSINKPMFLGNAARPATGKDVLQGLRLSDPCERIAENGFH